MAVAFDAKGTADVYGASGTSLTFSNLTVGTGSNRCIVVTLVFFDISTVPSLISCTWDSGGANQIMGQIGATQTLVVSPTRQTMSVALFGLVAPVSGKKTLAVSWVNSQADAFVDAVSFTGVNQTGGTTTFYNLTAATGTSGAPSVTVVSSQIGSAVDVAVSNFELLSPTQTVIFEDNGNGNFSSAGASYNINSASVVFGWPGAPGGQWVDYGVAIAAVGDRQLLSASFIGSGALNVGGAATIPTMVPNQLVYIPPGATNINNLTAPVYIGNTLDIIFCSGTTIVNAANNLQMLLTKPSGQQIAIGYPLCYVGNLDMPLRFANVLTVPAYTYCVGQILGLEIDQSGVWSVSLTDGKNSLSQSVTFFVNPT
jgi:hypothetical protein